MAGKGVNWGLVARRLIAVAVAAGIFWYVVRVPSRPAEDVPYIGDPLSGCAYPATELDPAKIAWVTGSEKRREGYDELQNLAVAKRAGYRVCPY